MKILQINAVYKNSSTGRICFDLHNYLKENGDECVTIYGNQKGDYEDTLYTGNIITQKSHALLTRITGKIGYFSRFQTEKVIRFIKKYKPDVVHLHNLHGNFICIPKLLRHLGENDIPTVVTLHDCFFYTGACTHYTVYNCFKWRDKCDDCKYNKLTWFFDKTKIMFSDKQKLFRDIRRLAVIGVSKWITAEAANSPILKNANVIKSIYNGIDLNLFRVKESDFKGKYKLDKCNIILGVASSWSEKKGLSLFLELSDRLSENEKIVLVGNIPRKNLPENIIHIPGTDNIEELVDIYNAADVLIQASKEETFGNVVAEAIACGTPVITNTYTANPELVDKTVGIVLDDFSVENIFCAVKEVIFNGKVFYNCREHAIKMFDKQAAYAEYLNVYKKIAVNR